MTSYRASTTRLPNGAVLAVGPKPPTGSAVARGGFQMLVLCAIEYQPPASKFPGVYVLHVPLTDHGAAMTSIERTLARRAARIVAKELSRGHNVLVTCRQGRNRSALVAAIALVQLGMSRPRSISHLRRMRFQALANKDFERMVAREDLSA
jgi:protein-tyrosine phosphatase